MIDQDVYYNLKEYYDEIRICLGCKKKYGIDLKDNGKSRMDNLFCPICSARLEDKISIVTSAIKHEEEMIKWTKWFEEWERSRKPFQNGSKCEIKPPVKKDKRVMIFPGGWRIDFEEF